MNDIRYTTLAAESQSELTRKRSRFLGLAAPAESLDEAQAFIKQCGTAHPDASHCCWAYRTGFPDQPAEHSSDAGEPSGTAGRPIAAAIAQAGLQNVVVVVVRWFGGVKLGVRGLIDAYHDTAAAALASGRAVATEPMTELRITLPYAHYGTIQRRIESLGGRIKADEFGAEVRCHCRVPRRQWPELAGEWTALGITVEKCE